MCSPYPSPLEEGKGSWKKKNHVLDIKIQFAIQSHRLIDKERKKMETEKGYHSINKPKDLIFNGEDMQKPSTNSNYRKINDFFHSIIGSD